MKSRKVIAICSLMAATTIAPLAAQSDFSNETMLTEFSIENVQPALRAAGAEELTETQTKDGDAQLRARFSDGRIIVATPRACTGGNNCRGLSMRAFWRPDPDRSPAEVQAIVNEYNDIAVAFGLVTNDNWIRLSYYIIADYGMPQGNLRVSTRVFLRDIDTLRAATTD